MSTVKVDCQLVDFLWLDCGTILSFDVELMFEMTDAAHWILPCVLQWLDFFDDLEIISHELRKGAAKSIGLRENKFYHDQFVESAEQLMKGYLGYQDRDDDGAEAKTVASRRNWVKFRVREWSLAPSF